MADPKRGIESGIATGLGATPEYLESPASDEIQTPCNESTERE
jgi:hypothetical protein